MRNHTTQPPSPESHPADGATVGARPVLFGHVLVGLSRQWRRMIQLRLAELGVADAAWQPLFHLDAEGDAVSLKVLAQRMGLESSTLVRVVDMLEAKGWVERQTDSADRRSKLLHVTDAGRAVVADIRSKLQQVEDRLLGGMDGATRQTVLQAMQALSSQLALELVKPHELESPELPDASAASAASATQAVGASTSAQSIP